MTKPFLSSLGEVEEQLKKNAQQQYQNQQANQLSQSSYNGKDNSSGFGGISQLISDQNKEDKLKIFKKYKKSQLNKKSNQNKSDQKLLPNYQQDNSMMLTGRKHQDLQILLDRVSKMSQLEYVSSKNKQQIKNKRLTNMVYGDLSQKEIKQISQIQSLDESLLQKSQSKKRHSVIDFSKYIFYDQKENNRPSTATRSQSQSVYNQSMFSARSQQQIVKLPILQQRQSQQIIKSEHQQENQETETQQIQKNDEDNENNDFVVKKKFKKLSMHQLKSDNVDKDEIKQNFEIINQSQNLLKVKKNFYETNPQFWDCEEVLKKKWKSAIKMQPSMFDKNKTKMLISPKKQRIFLQTNFSPRCLQNQKEFDIDFSFMNKFKNHDSDDEQRLIVELNGMVYKKTANVLDEIDQVFDLMMHNMESDIEFQSNIKLSQFQNKEEFLIIQKKFLRHVLLFDKIDPISYNKEFLGILMQEQLFEQFVDHFCQILIKLLYSSLAINDYKSLFKNYKIFVVENSIYNELGGNYMCEQLITQWIKKVVQNKKLQHLYGKITIIDLNTYKTAMIKFFVNVFKVDNIQILNENDLEEFKTLNYEKNLSFKDFYFMKLVLFEVFKLNNVHQKTIIKAMMILEKIRNRIFQNKKLKLKQKTRTVWFEEVKEIQEILIYQLQQQTTNNEALTNFFKEKEEFQILFLKSFIYNITIQDYQLYNSEEMILDKKIVMNENLFDQIKHSFARILYFQKFKALFIRDCLIRCDKMKQRVGLSKNLFDELGSSGKIKMLVEDLFNKSNENLLKQQTIQKQQKIKLMNSLSVPMDQEKEEFKINWLEFILFQLFSPMNIYSTLDFKASIQLFSVDQETLLNWQNAFNQICSNANLQNQFQDEIKFYIK